MNFYAVSRYMFGRQFPAHSLLRPAQRVSACRHIHPVETDSQRSGIAGIDDDPRTALGHCLSAAVRLGAIAGMVVITMMPGGSLRLHRHTLRTVQPRSDSGIGG